MNKLLRKNKYWLLLGITLLGAFLRLYQLDSLPPGDGYDVAQYGVDALNILDGSFPLFLTSNFGREVLFSYLVAFVFLFTGAGTLGIHLSSAIIGILTIPAVYLAAKELLAGEQDPLRTWGSLLAALVTAVSYWHLNWSRVGLRVIWVPLFASLIVAALWRGLRTGSRAASAVSGLLLGLSIYTYQAARLLPLLVLFAFLVKIAARRSLSRRTAEEMVLTFGLAFLVFAPLGLYAWRNPTALNDRLRQATLVDQSKSIQEQAQIILAQSKVALRMFVIEGDDEPQFTLSGRPSLNPFLSLFFLAGIVIALWRWKQPVFLFLLFWLLLMTAPAMLAGQAATAKRALGAFPVAVILIAIGLALPWQRFSSKTARTEPHARWRSWLLAAYGMVVIVGLAWTVVITYRDYFLRWGVDPGLPAHFQADHSEAGRYIGQLPLEETVFVSPFAVSHPAIQLHSRRHPNMRGYNGHFCLILPTGDTASSTTYVIVPGPQEKSLERLQQVFPGGQVARGPLRADTNQPYYLTYRVPDGSTIDIAPQQTADYIWDDKIKLLGYDLGRDSYQAGETINLTLYYQALQDGMANYTAFVHLLDDSDPANGIVLAGQVDSEPCRGALVTNNWQAGEIIVDSISVRIAEDASPGDYRLLTGFYNWPDLLRLPGVAQEEMDPEGLAALARIRVD